MDPIATMSDSQHDCCDEQNMSSGLVHNCDNDCGKCGTDIGTSSLALVSLCGVLPVTPTNAIIGGVAVLPESPFRESVIPPIG